MGPKAKTATAALMELLADSDTHLRSVAIKALQKINQPLAFDTYSGYFVSNKFEPGAAQSFVVVTNEEEFDRIFGAAVVMGDRSHRLPKGVFKENVVLTTIKRGKAVWTYRVECVTLDGGVVSLCYAAKSKASDTATFACPLIVSIPKGSYASVRFYENAKLTKQVDVRSGR
jgi:hypothetical protein